MFTFQVVLSSMRQNNTSYFLEYSFSDLLKKPFHCLLFTTSDEKVFKNGEWRCFQTGPQEILITIIPFSEVCIKR